MSKVIFSQEQLNFLEFVRVAFKKNAAQITAGTTHDLASMPQRIADWQKEWPIHSDFLMSREVLVKKGNLLSVYFIWMESGMCRVSWYVNLHKPYFDEEILHADHGEFGEEYGEWVYQESRHKGDLTWVEAAWMLYRFIGPLKGSDKAKFMQLVKQI